MSDARFDAQPLAVDRNIVDAAVAASIGRMVYCSLEKVSSLKVYLTWLDPGESGGYHYTRYLSDRYRGEMAKVFLLTSTDKGIVVNSHPW